MVNADVKQMQVMLKTVLKTKDLFINEKTNAIVIRDTPEVVALAAKLLAAQDISDPEVMMEVEVLEVRSTLLTELGLAYPDQVSFSVDGTIKTLQDWKHINSSKILVTPPGLGITLNAKKQDGDVNILANPRIRVRQHEKAKIHIGERFPIITNTVTPSTGTPVVTGSIQYYDLGLKLEVEPDIHLDNEVGIKTSLEISKLGGTVTNGSGDSQTTAYRFLTRTAVSTLRLKNGETQILGGLIDSGEANDVVKVPGLGDIPVLGRLFSSHKTDKSKMELVLAITPHIIRNVHQTDAELATYWSGTENEVKVRPVTVEKMEAIKIESSGAGSTLMSPATVLPVQPNKPEAVPEGAAAKPVVPVATPPVPAVTAPQTVPATNPVTGLPTFGTVRPPAARPGSSGMSDAEVKPPN
jgi:general secretion pathway protein D